MTPGLWIVTVALVATILAAVYAIGIRDQDPAVLGLLRSLARLSDAARNRKGDHE